MIRIVFAAALLLATSLQAQQKPVTMPKPEKGKGIVDTEIAALANEVSSDSIGRYIRVLAAFGTRHSLSDTIGEHQGIGAARRWVVSKLRSFAARNKADLRVTLDAFVAEAGPRIPARTTMKNVVAVQEGSDASDTRVLIVSAHLDSRNSDVMDAAGAAPGANDDASGVAVVLELARILSSRKLPCRIVYLAVQGEEQGLLGARHMAAKLKDEEVNVVAMLNNDIVGNITASETGQQADYTVRVFSEMIPAAETDAQAAARKALAAENDSPSRQLARYIRDISESYMKDFKATLNARPDRFLRGGDHTPFNQHGFPAVRFTEFHEDFTRQHQNVRVENNVRYGDLPEFVDAAYCARVARLNLITLVSLAKAPAAPVGAGMKMNLGNTTHLLWRAPAAGPRPKGYYVVMRETIQPFWESKFFFTGTEAVLPYSKDNYFFGVQAVGEHGHVSPVVIPAPVRE